MIWILETYGVLKAIPDELGDITPYRKRGWCLVIYRLPAPR
ncbi:hypothetical protein [Nostoc sp.]